MNETTNSKKKGKRPSQAKVASMNRLNSLIAKQLPKNTNELNLNIVTLDISKQQISQIPTKTDKILEDFMKI